MEIEELNNSLGDIDLHLLDLILKGKVSKTDRVLDAGCGSGRNLIYFLNQGYEVCALDKQASEVSTVNFLSRSLIHEEICKQGDLLDLPFEEAQFNFIICSRVLHFANDETEFLCMINELGRVLKPQGLLYISIASQIGLEEAVKDAGDGKCQFPDGSIRFTLRKDLLKKLEKDWVHEESPRTILFGLDHGETTLVLRPL